MRVLKIAILLVMFGASGQSAAAEHPAPSSDPVREAAAERPKPEDGHFRSLMPLAGYNPTYRIFAGGGYFIKRVKEHVERTSLSFVGVFAQTKVVKFEINWDQRLGERWRLDLRNELGNGFESNFGRGNNTRVEDRIDVPFWKDETEAYFPYAVTPHLSIGPGVEHRARRNHAKVREVENRQRDPIANEEFVVAPGIRQELDFRDLPGNPSLGWRQIFRVTTAFPYRGPVRSRSTTFDLSLELFQYLLDRDLVLAHSLAGGFIAGTPTYLNEFRLGGTDRLRGYFYNRFRGTKYYVEQTELRYPVFKAVGGAFFLEFGEATADRFSRAHASYGAGLRIGLPPDYISKVRIDYAKGRDQAGVFVDFGHPF